MEKAGVTVVPGTTDPVNSADEVKTLGAKYGFANRHQKQAPAAVVVE